MSIIKQFEECLPKERDENYFSFRQAIRDSKFDDGYNQALSQVRTESIPKMMKILREEIEKLPAFTSCSDKTMGKVADDAKKPRYGTNYLERETIITLLVWEDKSEEK